LSILRDMGEWRIVRFRAATRPIRARVRRLEVKGIAHVGDSACRMGARKVQFSKSRTIGVGDFETFERDRRSGGRHDAPGDCLDVGEQVGLLSRSEFSGDRRTIVAIGKDGQIRFWDVDGREAAESLDVRLESPATETIEPPARPRGRAGGSDEWFRQPCFGLASGDRSGFRFRAGGFAGRWCAAHAE
jgi:hypothetical protein